MSIINSISGFFKLTAQALLGNFSLSGFRDSTVHAALPPTNEDNWRTRFAYQHRQTEYAHPRKSERTAAEVQDLKLKAQAKREARAYKRQVNHDWAAANQPIDSTYHAMVGLYAPR